ncbi:immediate early response gene 2 protein [Heteronotia binoei]|uniref:immediate early response gene 2 protein n=1 Tax=Heteronotia binoei TaxID=13085 RepID=UPI00292D8470|nr:immediate early response gene 2 protein [Heteronotia binoei]
MEVQKEAQRIMTMSVWKMYHSRMQRGGLRLHRSLQLSLVMRNARDLYLAAKLEGEEGDAGEGAPASPEPMDAQPSWSPAAKPSRKRRSSSLGAAEAGAAPSKRAKLEEEEERQPQRQEGPFPGLARVLQRRFSGEEAARASCRRGDGVLSIVVRAVVAF